MAHSEMPCQEITINQKALFLREFEKWLMHYLECSQESGKGGRNSGGCGCISSVDEG